jgi:hypothetical protein
MVTRSFGRWDMQTMKVGTGKSGGGVGLPIIIVTSEVTFSGVMTRRLLAGMGAGGIYWSA